MNITDSEMMTLAKRINRLERETRLTRWAAGVVVMAVGAFFALGLKDGDDKAVGRFKQVDCGQVIIRDSDGQMRAWLGLAEGGGRLIFFDHTGMQRLGVGMTRQAEPAVGIFDTSQNERAVLGIMEGWPGLVLRDPQGKKRTALYSREDWSSLFFYDKREMKRTGIGIYGEAAAINLSDNRGKDRAGLTTDPKGSSVCFFDRGGQKRAGVGILSDDQPALGFFNHEGENQVALTVLNNEPALNMYGTNRLEVAITVPSTNSPKIEIFGAEHVRQWKAP